MRKGRATLAGVATVMIAAGLGEAPLAAQAVVSPKLPAQATFGSAAGGTENLERYLFTPELIMRHYREIGLEPDQRARITEAVEELQVGLVDLQWRLMEATQQLEEALAATSVEQQRALSLVDQVLAMEREVKTRHLTALIRIKNTLTEEQQEQLADLRGWTFGAFSYLPATGTGVGDVVRTLGGELQIRAHDNAVRAFEEGLRGGVRIVPEEGTGGGG